MSKIGRKPIELSGVQVEIKNNEIHYKGKKASGVYVLPSLLKAELINNKVKLTASNHSSKNNELWGLHRALLANIIKGSSEGFSAQLIITGLGFKGVLAGDRIDFSLGFAHKIPYKIPSGITIEIDKTGQLLTVKGVDKQQVGEVCSEIKALRSTEPYKGTGIKLSNETILRKAGKTKSA